MTNLEVDRTNITNMINRPIDQPAVNSSKIKNKIEKIENPMVFFLNDRSAFATVSYNFGSVCSSPLFALQSGIGSPVLAFVIKQLIIFYHIFFSERLILDQI
jgi:hypothetical protein